VPPRLLTVQEGDHRHASWLELFFDLVFVVAITQLSHELVVDHSTGGFLRFAALFVPVYVAWQGCMAYETRFDTDDVAFRLAYFVAMLAVAAMAVLIDDVAHGHSSAAFAGAFVTLRSVMLALYWRAWRAVPEARELISFYGAVTRWVTVTGPRRLGVSLKLGAAAVILGLLGVEPALPPVALAGAVALVLVAVVVLERLLLPPP
jgi:low temperature requirement protein LtrA